MLDFNPSRTTCVRARVRRLVVVLGFLGIAGPARAWDASTAPVFFPSVFDTEYFASVARQANGGLIVAGTHMHPNVGDYEFACSLIVARLVESTGAVDWRTELDDCGDDETWVFNPRSSLGSEVVRVDATGDAFVARSRTGGTALEVLKLDGSSGAVLWRQNVARPGERNSTTHTIAVDPAGDVVVAGGDGTDDRVPSDLFVTKLSGTTGTALWRRELRGPSNSEDDARNRADAVAIDASGNVVVHGVLYDVDAERDPLPLPLLLALDGTDGHERWRADGMGVTAGVAFDDDGDVVITSGGEVAKRAGGNGTAIWRTRVGDAAPAIDSYAAHLALRGETIAVAADAPLVGGEHAVLVTVLDAASGARRWQGTIESADVSGPSRITDRAAGVGIDDAGDVVVAASIVDPGAFSRPLVAAFDGARGGERWRHTFAGTPSAHAGAFDLLVDGTNAVVVGGVGRPGAFSDAFVALLSTTAGDQAWLDDDSARLPTDTRGLWLDEVAYDAAVDTRGDVIAVGKTWSGIEAIDFAVRKLDGRTGATRWRNEQERPKRFDGGLSSDAIGERVEIDGHGDAIALSGNFIGLIVKLAGADGSVAWARNVNPLLPTYLPLARPFAVDEAGDVLVVGDDARTIAGSFEDVMVVKKLSGTSGAQQWDAAIAARASLSVAVDPSDDVLAVGEGSAKLRETLLVKYDGTSGAELWHHRSATTLQPELLTVDGAGDPLVATRRDTGNLFALGMVLKIDGTSGTERWQSADLWGESSALEVDGHGDVLAAGNSTTDASAGVPLTHQAAAAKLDGATGATVWRRALDDRGANVEVVAAVVDASGDLVVAAREVPGRTWLAGLRGSDGTLLWTIGIGDADTTFDVRALRLRAPGQLVVAGGRAAPGEGFAFAVLGLDVAQIVGPTGTGRSCTVQFPATRGPARLGPTVGRCTSLAGPRIPMHR